MSSSSPDTGAFAKGELRVGRVLGRPRPRPNGEAATGTGAARGVLDGGDGFFSGLPGGVVLSSRIVDKRPSEESESSSSSSSSSGAGDFDTLILGGTSARGVEEGDLEGGSGTFEGDGDRESSSPSSSSGGASEPESKLSERKESPSSSSSPGSPSSSSPPSSSPSASSSASPPETSTNELDWDKPSNEDSDVPFPSLGEK